MNSYADLPDSQTVRDLIIKLGLSQRAAARALDIDERTMRYWCSGSRPVPYMAILALERLVDQQKVVR